MSSSDPSKSDMMSCIGSICKPKTISKVRKRKRYSISALSKVRKRKRYSIKRKFR